ncbi:MAG: hypothetical protein WBG12_06915 [Xanthobacteraceae bacterium]
MTVSLLPSGLARDGAGHARRKIAVTRDDDPARLTWTFVHVVVAAVALDPIVSL